MEKIYVINARGEREIFSKMKVYRSALRAGASKELAIEVAKILEKKIYPDIKTFEIYRNVRSLLRKKEPRTGIKYQIKDSIRKLGPTGFPFEKFVASIFRARGFKTRTNLILKGKCLSYEIDFLAESDKEIFVGECKFHRDAGRMVDQNITLSNYSRFLDILNGGSFSSSKKEIKTILVTNNKFSSSAKRYSKCMNLDVLGWGHPIENSLQKQIEDNKLYPITILPSCRGFLKDILFENKISLVRDLLVLDSKKLAHRLKLREKELNRIIKEANIILNNK